MTAIEEPVAIDGAKLEAFVFRAVDEVGAALNAALVVMGDKLGLYRAMAGAGALTPVELARRAGVAERYVREWLNAQAAGGYVTYDPAAGSYALLARATTGKTTSFDAIEAEGKNYRRYWLPVRDRSGRVVVARALPAAHATSGANSSWP